MYESLGRPSENYGKRSEIVVSALSRAIQYIRFIGSRIQEQFIVQDRKAGSPLRTQLQVMSFVTNQWQML